MINQIRLRPGPSPGSSPEVIDATPVTVFVGPNNSGKSLILQEIYQFCLSGSTNNALILNALKFAPVSDAEAELVVEGLKVKPNPNEFPREGNIVIKGPGANRHEAPRRDLITSLTNPAIDLAAFCRHFMQRQTLMLDGRRRVDLVNQQAAGKLQTPVTSFQVLFSDDLKRSEMRRITSEAFGTYFVVDPTTLGNLRIKLSPRLPKSDRHERALDEEAIRFYEEADPIESFSDGVKAYVGTLAELTAGDPRVVLIDEPEAFLHPSLAAKLGSEISRAAARSNKRVFASTHSPAFVMGCIQSGTPVTIVRLTYRSDVSTARVLKSRELIEMMRQPLLRSSNVISGLFYECVIVTESDTDRAFYQEINERLLRFKPEWAIPNCLFLNAQNKQTIPTILRPLRQMGIPTAGIVDVDVVKEGGGVWTKLLTSLDIPDLSHPSLATLRSSVKSAADSTGREMRTDGGIKILGKTGEETAQNLLDQLASYGMFVVSDGELESWLKPLGAVRHGTPWLIDIFEKMGEDPGEPSYVRPAVDDVWAFMSRIRGWLTDPVRKGIPD